MLLKDRRDLHMFKCIEGIGREGRGRGQSQRRRGHGTQGTGGRISLREDSQRLHASRVKGEKDVCGFRSICGTGSLDRSP